MDCFKICFMMVDDGFALEVAPVTDESEKFIISLLSCFGEFVDGEFSVKAEQKATKELKQKVTEFTNTHAGSNPRLNKLNSKIKNIAEDTFFLVLHDIPADTAAKHKLEIYLELLNKTNEDLTQEVFQGELEFSSTLFGDILENYNIHQPRNDRRTIIGNSRKDYRKCRFCGDSQADGARFSKVAHAIPEALGNKNIILADECDECNKFFGDNIEPNLIEYLDIYRAFLGVKGKNGAPTISYNNGKIANENGMAVVVASKIEETSDQELIVKFESSKRFTPIKFYKALCKITLSTLAEQELDGLNVAVRWLRYGDCSLSKVPKVATNIVNSGFSKIPQITNYVRKNKNTTLPHVISEFRFGSFVYVYVVPFSQKDELDFSDPTIFEAYWRQLQHYNRIPGWRFDNFDGSIETTVNETIRIIKSDS